MPRVLRPPPEHSPPDEVAAALLAAVWAYATGTDGRDLSAGQRAVGMHHLAVLTERGFNTALARAKQQVTWPVLTRAHGMRLSSLQRRMQRAVAPPPGGEPQ